ncbi:hypothetical protein Lesp02_84030 [Lentzea sp. NBRC 105346]|uniref:head-tail connector protein n=1 Tax=Lentzea sp. NBRC 105346 TaxID=3032205 RepID=UPI0024A1650A|nr:head-tail connector protein [Lentzea sp. NBRC 105346]GLZ36216.1 hypothetical protein Lesp02_84030 [Lentzea sp. NBRC 105346]
MASTNYATLPLLKESLGISDNVSDNLLEPALASASRSIDNATGRRFWIDDSATARVYRPAERTVVQRGGVLLLVDDIADTTELVVEQGTTGSWTALTDYETEPENALARSRPITGLLRLGAWGGGYAMRVRVTARWGWPSVPDEVVQATLIQAARLYRRKDSPEGVTSTSEWGPIRVNRLDPDVQALLAHLVLPAFG